MKTRFILATVLLEIALLSPFIVGLCVNGTGWTELIGAGTMLTLFFGVSIYMDRE